MQLWAYRCLIVWSVYYFYIYLQILAALCIIAAAICIDAKQKRDLHGRQLVLDAYSHIDVRAANGWLIFVSAVLIIFQTAAIVELFVDDIKVLKIKIPFGGSLWYLVTIIVSHHSNGAGLHSPRGGGGINKTPVLSLIVYRTEQNSNHNIIAKIMSY